MKHTAVDALSNPKIVTFAPMERRQPEYIAGSNPAKPTQEMPDCIQAELYCRLTRLLWECGIPANLCGYGYIRESVLLDYTGAGYRHAVTKALYPEVAAMFNSTPSRVERGIRHAISVAWERRGGAMQTLFGGTGRERPTNSEFIATVSDYLRLMYPAA